MENNNVKRICEILSKKKADNICIIDISSQSVIADYFVICDAASTPQTKTLCEAVEEEMEKDGIMATRKEGIKDGRWIVLDYTDVIVHIFLKEEREFYNIEKLWTNGTNMTVYED